MHWLSPLEQEWPQRAHRSSLPSPCQICCVEMPKENYRHSMEVITPFLPHFRHFEHCPSPSVLVYATSLQWKRTRGLWETKQSTMILLQYPYNNLLWVQIIAWHPSGVLPWLCIQQSSSELARFPWKTPEHQTITIVKEWRRSLIGRLLAANTQINVHLTDNVVWFCVDVCAYLQKQKTGWGKLIIQREKSKLTVSFYQNFSSTGKKKELCWYAAYFFHSQLKKLTFLPSMTIPSQSTNFYAYPTSRYLISNKLHS